MNPQIIIYGASDDLIEIDGDINEEFSYWPKDSGDARYLTFSDGTVLRVNYDQDGIWRLVRIANGLATFEKVDGDVEADTVDKVTLSGVAIEWVAMADVVVRRRKRGNDAD